MTMAAVATALLVALQAPPAASSARHLVPFIMQQWLQGSSEEGEGASWPAGRQAATHYIGATQDDGSSGPFISHSKYNCSVTVATNR